MLQWKLTIVLYVNFTKRNQGIKYQKGKCHCNADLLSRHPLHTYGNSLKNELDDSEPELQPIATINVITRFRNYYQAATSDEQTKNTSGNSSPKSTTTKIDNTRLRVVTGSNPTSSSTNKLCKILPTHSGFSMTKLKEEQIKDADIQKK
ncbi:unnamed protein product [Rotaria magnacalcarata]|uniref:Uncharacterized protein n=1 Tax=Rotaria magnacalcarata TaxID=392030 RepID=A0A819QPS7_9BILA|nr:unnamed protein product [Rotaria magnacalcarata]